MKKDIYTKKLEQLVRELRKCAHKFRLGEQGKMNCDLSMADCELAAKAYEHAMFAVEDLI